MPEITMQALRDWAGRDVELRAVTEDEQATIQAGERTFGGRVARNLKIGLLNEDRTAKREQYREAKDAVLAALKREYGEAIGLKAFRAGVGRARDGGGWETSVDHPLTGRQIERMLSVADRESARKAPAAGLLEVEPRLVGLQAVEGPKGRMKAGEALDAVLGSLAREIATWHQAGGAGPRVWMLEVGYEGVPDGARIGIRLDRADDGMAQVVGRDGQRAEVALDDLPEWLAAEQLGGQVRSLALLRADIERTPEVRSLEDWVGDARNLPAGERDEVGVTETRTLGQNRGRSVANYINQDVDDWVSSASGRLGVTDEFYILDIEPPRDQIGLERQRIGIRVAGDWSHPTYGRRHGDGPPNPERSAEVRDTDGTLHRMPLAQLEGWLNERLATVAGTFTIGRQTPCPSLEPIARRLAARAFTTEDSEARNDLSRLKDCALRIEMVARRGIGDEVDLAITELETLRRQVEPPEDDPRIEGRAERWRNEPEVMALFAEAEQTMRTEIDRQIDRLRRIGEALPPPEPPPEVTVGGPGDPLAALREIELPRACQDDLARLERARDRLQWHETEFTDLRGRGDLPEQIEMLGRIRDSVTVDPRWSEVGQDPAEAFRRLAADLRARIDRRIGTLSKALPGREGVKVAMDPLPPVLEPAPDETGRLLPLRRPAKRGEAQKQRSAEMRQVAEQWRAGLSRMPILAPEAEAARLIAGAGTVPVRLSLGGDAPRALGDLSPGELLEAVGRLEGVGEDPERRAGLARLLGDEGFRAVHQDAIRQLYPLLDLQEDVARYSALDVQVKPTDEGWDVTFSAPLPGPLDFREDRHREAAAGRLERPLLVMTAHVARNQLDLQAPSLRLDAPRVVEGPEQQ
jgi:hypothetical protein